ncbi:MULTISPECIES: hypothetical protein [unclassified Photobacterium]|uniref:hypothetical protein n=1 Tax=unclassified Photobacterium TaxID=2628852 RepID=UPI001EDF8303|nr:MULTISPECIES: hypothetical protein [unclassified Photobacterium]MCG3864275.1 hypothetical protein [Photobacterium sp. Ph6]MCG3875755.1 hypothetical protein [Photobacterium sp. Ph5]
MKLIKWLALCVAVTFQVQAKPVPVIPTKIDFVSTQWLEHRGTFRVVVFNSEDNPCFIVENYQQGMSEGLTSTRSICRVVLPDQTVVNVLDDPIGGMWFEHFRWGEGALNFNLNTESAEYSCSLDLTKEKKLLAQCYLPQKQMKTE